MEDVLEEGGAVVPAAYPVNWPVLLLLPIVAAVEERVVEGSTVETNEAWPAILAAPAAIDDVRGSRTLVLDTLELTGGGEEVRLNGWLDSVLEMVNAMMLDSVNPEFASVEDQSTCA